MYRLLAFAQFFLVSLFTQAQEPQSLETIQKEVWRYQVQLKKLPVDIYRMNGGFFSAQGIFFELRARAKFLPDPLCFIQKGQSSEVLNLNSSKSPINFRILGLNFEENYSKPYSFTENGSQVDDKLNGTIWRLYLRKTSTKTPSSVDAKGIESNESGTLENQAQIEVSCLFQNRVSGLTDSDLQKALAPYFLIEKQQIKELKTKFEVTHSELVLEKPFVSSSAIVTVPALPLSARGIPKAGRFSADQLSVLLDGIPQKVLSINYKPLPQRYVFHIDASGSMAGYRQDMFKETIQFSRAVLSDAKDSLFGAAIFSGNFVNHSMSVLCNATQILSRFIECLSNYPTGDGSTPLWTTLTSLVRTLGEDFRSQLLSASSLDIIDSSRLPKTPVVIVFTDGDDTQFSVDFMSTKEQVAFANGLSKYNTPVHFVLFGTRSTPFINEVVGQTGGTVAQMGTGRSYLGILQKIQNAIPTIHEIQFQPSVNKDGETQYMQLDGKNHALKLRAKDVEFLYHPNILLSKSVRR